MMCEKTSFILDNDVVKTVDDTCILQNVYFEVNKRQIWRNLAVFFCLNQLKTDRYLSLISEDGRAVSQIYYC